MRASAAFGHGWPCWALPLPLLHTHSALALVLLCLVGGVYTLAQGARRETLLPWLGLAAVCGAAWLAQMLPTVLAQSLDGQHMLRLHFNWINGQDDGTLKDNYFWFYIKNIGLVYLLLVPAFIHAKPKQRWLYGGGLAILALAEFVVFQPNNYDNNKLLYVWHMLGCILAAQLLVDLFAKVRALPWRALGLAVCCFAAIFGSVLTAGREIFSDYQHWSANDIALADYIDANAESDALFLTSDSHVTPVFALAGRRILCGSGSYVYYHGMDYADEYSAMAALYEHPNEGTLAAWDVGYVLFDFSVYGANLPMQTRVGTPRGIPSGTKMTDAACIKLYKQDPRRMFSCAGICQQQGIQFRVTFKCHRFFSPPLVKTV